MFVTLKLQNIIFKKKSFNSIKPFFVYLNYYKNLLNIINVSFNNSLPKISRQYLIKLL